MAEFLGREGSMTYATVAMGNCKVVGYEVRRARIDKTVKGDRHMKSRVGLPERTIRFSGHLDYVTGQQDVIDFLENSTPDETEGSLVFTVATGKTWTWATAIFLGYTITSPEGDAVVTFECEFAANDKATVAWA